ncbi:hypothetical protein P692DRAFT_20877183 [Suillus brevipes Sb2]|nr:hypothetical protein P692DRAFT_20877183 [Suillus brevipes Sb2]
MTDRDPDLSKLQAAFERCGVFAIERKPSEFTVKCVEDDIKKSTIDSVRICCSDSPICTFCLLWCRALGLGWAAKVGGTIIPTKMIVMRPVSDPEGPQIALVTQRRADNSLVDTVLFHVNALTGDDVREENPFVPRAALQGLDAVMGPLVDVFVLPNENRTIVMLDEYLQARLYPDTPSAQAEFESFVPSIHLGGAPRRSLPKL